MKKRKIEFMKPASNKSYFKMLFRMFLIFQIVLLVSNILIFLFIKRVLAQDIKAYNINAINSIRSSVEDTFMEMTKVCTSARLPAHKLNQIYDFRDQKPEKYIILGEVRRDFANLFSIRRSYDKWFYYNAEKGIIIDASGIYNSEEYLCHYYEYVGVNKQDIEEYVSMPTEQSKILPISVFHERQLMQTLSESVIPFIYSYQESIGQKSIVVINYSLKNLDRISSAYLTSDQMGIMITDENGNVLSLVGSLIEEGIEHVSQIRLQGDHLSIEQKKFGGKKYSVMSHKIEFSNWTIHISIPSNVFYRKSNMVFLLLMMANLSIALVGGGIAYGFSRRLFSPIYNLFSVLYPQKDLSRYRFNQNELELIRSRFEEIKQSNFNFTTKMRYMEPIFENSFFKKILEQKDFLKEEHNIQFLKENTSLSICKITYFCDVRFAFHPFFLKKLSSDEKEQMLHDLHSVLISMLVISVDQVVSIDVEQNHMIFLMQYTSEDTEDQLLSALEDLRRLFEYDTDNIRISFVVGRSPDMFSLRMLYFDAGQLYGHIPLSQLANKVWSVDEKVKEKKVLTINWDKLDNIVKAGEPKKAETFIEQQIMPLSKKMTIKSMEMFYRECYQTCKDIIEREGWECSEIVLFEEIDVSQFFSVEEFVICLKEIVLLVCGCPEAKGLSRREDFIEYIKSYYAEENVSLESMADHFQISPNHLSKVFKEQIGVSFTDYLASYRIEQAKKLLLTTKETISQVGSIVGIPSRVTFNRLFNKFEGISPGKYRAIHDDVVDN